MNQWRIKHGFEPISRALLPMLGAIVDDTAIGLLYLTNSDAAWIDNMTSNPDAQPKKVAKAVDAIVMRLIDTAREHGVKQLYGVTSKKSMAKWIKRLGFERAVEDYIVLCRRV